jgi:hypothetical protein
MGQDPVALTSARCSFLSAQGDSEKLHSGAPNVSLCRVLRKTFTLKGVQTIHRSTPCTPLSVHVLVTLTTLNCQ